MVYFKVPSVASEERFLAVILRVQCVTQDSRARLTVCVRCVTDHRHCEKANNKGQFLNVNLQLLKLWHLVHTCSLTIFLWLDLEFLPLLVVAESRKGPLHDQLHWPVDIRKVMFLVELKSTVCDSPHLCITSVFSFGSTECYRLCNNLFLN